MPRNLPATSPLRRWAVALLALGAAAVIGLVILFVADESGRGSNDVDPTDPESITLADGEQRSLTFVVQP